MSPPVVPPRIDSVLVVGSWAKEQITIENLRQGSGLSVSAFMDTVNPAIVDLVDDYRVGSFDDVDSIADFAVRCGAELVVPTVAAPLAAGLVDALEEHGIAAFGPRRAEARLESDKAFARDLLARCCPEVVPAFGVFDGVTEAVDFARALQWQVAVKPLGLTDGLGVRVWGDQLTSESEATAFITEVIDRGLGGSSRVIIEEKLVGEEFTVQCLVDGTRCVATPAVQDFKKLLAGERGPNTASMGSYSDTGQLLPFLAQGDYDAALGVIHRTLTALNENLGTSTRGFLYGQFMITRAGLKLIEYNFRPGDPEWLNTVSVLEDNLLDLIVELMAGGEPSPRFSPQATVCKYVVPPGYPEHFDQVLELEIDQEQVRQAGARPYFSCGLDRRGRLTVGSERGVALVAAADTISAAQEMVEKAISTLGGSFRYRHDIGTQELLARTKENAMDIYAERLEFRPIREDEFAAVHQFVHNCPGLEPYPVHLFRIVGRHLGNTCFAAVDHDEIVAFAMGFFSQHDPSTYFLWEIGVSPSRQGRGLGARLLDHVEKQVVARGARKIEATIHPENVPSRTVFERAGYTNCSAREGDPIEIAGEAAARDFYGPGRHFMVCEKVICRSGERAAGSQ